jgi:hypothetical protein
MVSKPTFLHLHRISLPLAWSDDSDSDEHESDKDDCRSDFSEQQKPINFIDIAARAILCSYRAPPTKPFEPNADLLHAGRKRALCNPLQNAIVANDFETFVHTLDLYDSVEMTIWPYSGTYNLAVAFDPPEILDEFIRRSGVGIPVPSGAAKGLGTESKVSEERVYLGLDSVQ